MHDYLGEHPKIAMIISASSIVIAEAAETTKHIQPLVIEILQCVAWSLGICVSLVTLISWYKKNYGNENKGRKKSK